MIAKSYTIVGDGSAHTFASALTGASQCQAKWVIGAPPSGNSGSALVGGVEVSATVGFPLPAGSSLIFPPISELSSRYDLRQEYYYLSNGDKLNVLVGWD